MSKRESISRHHFTKWLMARCTKFFSTWDVSEDNPLLAYVQCARKARKVVWHSAGVIYIQQPSLSWRTLMVPEWGCILVEEIHELTQERIQGRTVLKILERIA